MFIFLKLGRIILIDVSNISFYSLFLLFVLADFPFNHTRHSLLSLFLWSFLLFQKHLFTRGWLKKKSFPLFGTSFIPCQCFMGFWKQRDNSCTDVAEYTSFTHSNAYQSRLAINIQLSPRFFCCILGYQDWWCLCTVFFLIWYHTDAITNWNWTINNWYWPSDLHEYRSFLRIKLDTSCLFNIRLLQF